MKDLLARTVCITLVIIFVPLLIAVGLGEAAVERILAWGAKR